MIDYASLRAEWDDLLGRRSALGTALGFWTPVIDGWVAWQPGPLPALAWSVGECRERWRRGVPLLAEAQPDIPREALEELLGPMVERLACAGPGSADAMQRFAEAWDAGQIGPANLLPGSGKDGPTALQERLGLDARLIAFLAVAGLRPALDTFFESVRTLAEGVWTPGGCPWCGGMAGYADIVEDGRRQLSCHLCGGAWIAPRLRCPFCESWQSGDLVRLVGEDVEEGYFIEACRSCHGYLKGVDRRQRWNAGAALVEDWGSPHLDVYAAREGYWRATPSLSHLLQK